MLIHVQLPFCQCIECFIIFITDTFHPHNNDIHIWTEFFPLDVSYKKISHNLEGTTLNLLSMLSVCPSGLWTHKLGLTKTNQACSKCHFVVTNCWFRIKTTKRFQAIKLVVNLAN